MSIDLATPEADAFVRFDEEDTPPVEIFNGSGRAHALVVCDHAGNHIPARLGQLGVSDAELGRHIGWDVGAADVARTVARLLDAPAVLCHVSRLVIDPNRVPGHPTSILPVSDGTPVPGNRENF